MPRWRIRGCPRCGGDIFIDRDLNGWHEQCLQCSYRHELKDLAEFKEPPAKTEKEPTRAG